MNTWQLVAGNTTTKSSSTTRDNAAASSILALCVRSKPIMELIKEVAGRKDAMPSMVIELLRTVVVCNTVSDRWCVIR